MRKALLIGLAAAIAITVLAGCGTGTYGLRTDREAGNASVPGSISPTGPAGEATPEQVVREYCAAEIAGDIERQKACWDSASIDRWTVRTTPISKVLELETTGSGNRRTVNAKLVFLGCEAPEPFEGYMTFKLEKTGAGWKITENRYR